MIDKVMWRGIAKLNEECGEVIQLIGKLMAYPAGDHPDGKGHLKHRLEDELADLKAAIAVVMVKNNLDTVRIYKRIEKKQALFATWIMAGITREKETE